MPSPTTCPESTIESANRRKFIKKAALATAAVSVGSRLLASGSVFIPESSAESAIQESRRNPHKSKKPAKPAKSQCTFAHYCATCVAIEGETCTGTGVEGYAFACCYCCCIAYSSKGVAGISQLGYGTYGCSCYGTGAYGRACYGTGVAGYSLDGSGVQGSSTSGVGIQGNSSSNVGVVGYSDSGIGICGYSGPGIGVKGSSFCSFGVYGCSPTNYGVYGNSLSKSGVYGFSSGTGVAGITGASNTGAGVYGCSPCGPGVQAKSNTKSAICAVTNSPTTGAFKNSGGSSDKSAAVQIESGCSVIWNAGVGGTGDAHGVTKGQFFFGHCGPKMVLATCGKVGIGTIAPNSTLQVNGGVSVGVVVLDTTPFAMSSSDYALLVNAGVETIKVTLPPASNTGQMVVIKKIDSSKNAVTVNRHGTDTIEGSTSKSLPMQYDSLTLIAGGNGIWYILSNAT
jgi:hypothetical protein